MGSGSKMILCPYFLILFTCLSTTTCISKAPNDSSKVTAMYVFGDSLVDVGNNNYLKLSLVKANFPHNGIDFPTGKPTGRFSNGKNAADFIAEKLGLPTAIPYLSIMKSNFDTTNAMISGVSFASGGAGFFDERFEQSISLTKQVEYYGMVYKEVVEAMGSEAAQYHFSKALFPIVIGSNDLFDYFKPDSDVSKIYTPQQYVDSMLSALHLVLKNVHDLGGRKFVIVGIGAIGCTPLRRMQSNTQDCNEEINYWATIYNSGLKTLLQTFKSEFNDINYSYFDVFPVFREFIQNPTAYGFTEVKAACCGFGELNALIPCLPLSTYCSNRDEHLFWDRYHPIQKTASLFVDMIVNGSQYVTPINVNQLVAL